jgi:hypothetical protein
MGVARCAFSSLLASKAHAWLKSAANCDTPGHQHWVIHVDNNEADCSRARPECKNPLIIPCQFPAMLCYANGMYITFSGKG